MPANRFSVQPANVMTGMNALREGINTRVDMERKKAAQVSRQGLRERAGNLFENGTPEEIRKFATENPEIVKEMAGSTKDRADIQRQNYVSTAKRVLFEGVDPATALIENADRVAGDGIDASETMQAAQESMSDPATGIRKMEVALALYGSKSDWDQYQQLKGGGTADSDTKPYSPTGEDRYVEDKGNEWLANNPRATEVPAGLGAGWRLEHKRAQAGELAASATAKKTAELDVIKKMQPGIERDKAIATYQAKSEEERGQKIINTGLEAAEGMSNLKRGIELLETIETGGINSVSLATKRFFGAEGADEGELSYRLARKVLAQLKETFGAQFTEGESAKLERIESNFSKSPANNKRLLSQALRISQRKVDSARRYASRRGDKTTVEELDEWANFSLSTDISDLPEGVTEEDITTTMQLRNMTREQVLTKLGAN